MGNCSCYRITCYLEDDDAAASFRFELAEFLDYNAERYAVGYGVAPKVTAVLFLKENCAMRFLYILQLMEDVQFEISKGDEEHFLYNSLRGLLSEYQNVSVKGLSAELYCSVRQVRDA